MLTGNENKLFIYNVDRLIVTKKTLMIKIFKVVVMITAWLGMMMMTMMMMMMIMIKMMMMSRTTIKIMTVWLK